ncbi:hypothetical protein Q31b_27710 [Novipirellula aureliae]|uniref:Pilus formation protein N-terminal domain-containing protein n=1 Tax=Novipirellula aureliae TaxID=2527966 RepID=A0A5C6DXH3_9BACT|nr:pilus assembly protein N-terminal domain-containing protein [Novipirellula aureliae]TWU41332.1 hypothetical protein Q31b_27710 [Novipirellula aureliae]
MRGANYTMDKRRRTKSRSYRRAMLSLWLVAVGASASASEPIGARHDADEMHATKPATALKVRMLPPLPIEAIDSPPIAQVSGTAVQMNPYCGDLNVQADPLIKLASGDFTAGEDRSAVRLKPIGAAIGLYPIGSPALPSNGRPAMTIETPPSAPVRTNPMLASQHHVNHELVDVELTETEASSPTDPSELSFRPPVKVQAYTSAQVQPNPVETAQRVEHEPDTDSQPILFSMSDDEDVLPTINEVEQMVVAEESMDAVPMPDPVVIDHGGEYSEEEMAMLKLMLEEEDEVRREPIADSAPMGLQPLETSERIDLGGRTEMSEPIKPIAIDVVPHIDETNVVSEDSRVASLRKKRYRPPVDVKAPPVGAERGPLDPTASIIRPVVTAVVAPRLDASPVPSNPRVILDTGKQNMPVAGSSEPIPLYINLAQVRSLTVDGELRRVSVQNPSICRAFTSGSSQVKLIGAGSGVTRLVVWADTDTNVPTKVRQFDIHVRDTAAATNDSVGDKVVVLNRTIAKTFPNARVDVRMVDSELVISGNCDSESSAKQIVRMVRKACLVPVRDELGVR